MSGVGYQKLQAPGLSRRLFLQGGGLLAASFGLGLPAFARAALAGEGVQAQPGKRQKVFAFLFLRGALDGLHAVQPHGERRLASLRPDLLLPAPGAAKKSDALQPLLDLGVPGFGLHAALAPLLPLWQDGALALVHAVGSPGNTRSHFDAQDMLELGTPGLKNTPDGWLSRALGAAPTAGERSPLEAVAITGKLPRSLQGTAGALAFASVEQLRLRPLAGAGGEKGRARSRAAFEALYARSADEALSAQGKEAFAALQLLDKKIGKDGLPTAPGASYPQGPLGSSLKQLAQLIKADVGLRVACTEAGGWDTHSGQPGALSRGLGDLGQALAAFHRDLGDRAGEVVLVAATEFGRTVRQNGAQGTDHGHGSVAFVLGGPVAGGKLHGRWPGLEDSQLFEGRDLAVTTDLRQVLLACAEAQLGPLDAGKVFPGFTAGPLPGLLRAV